MEVHVNIKIGGTKIRQKTGEKFGQNFYYLLILGLLLFFVKFLLIN
jgi:hypothetical protein